VKPFFIIEGEIKTFHNKKQKLFMAIKLALQKYLKESYIWKRKINITMNIWEGLNIIRLDK
jgi:hypothetical protein